LAKPKKYTNEKKLIGEKQQATLNRKAQTFDESEDNIFQTLPTEILVLIGKYLLSVKDVIAFSLSCRLGYAVCCLLWAPYAKMRDLNETTPLHLAAWKNKISAVERLIELGADINAQDILGHTPLHVAVACRAYDVVQMLMAMGADQTLTDVAGHRPQDFERLASLSW
jgi:hypothetical protein